MKRALLVVDVQESFRQRESWRDISAPDIAQRCQRLVDAARADGDLVIWVVHTEPGTGSMFDPELGHTKLLAELDRADDEPLLYKTSHNAFTTTNLHQLLTAEGVGEVRVCGIRTEQCCETTARLASDLGFAVTFVLDATATHPLGPLSASEVIERTKHALDGRFARIASLDTLTGS